MKKWIKNYDNLATTKLRQDALEILETAYDAIDTEKIIRESITLDDDVLKIKDQTFDLTKFQRLKVIGFGKASCKAAYVLEQIIGNKIKSGIAIGTSLVSCKYIKTYQGTHPEPSSQNVAVSKDIMEMSQASTADDLVIVIVSGGGSALLCWPQEECDQGQILYHQFLKTGGSIKELNIVRKHLSLLKGGGLSKELYPATVVSLIFSDVPGDDFGMIASGPTYKDETTINDAQEIINKYQLGTFNLNETPKDDKYFEKVRNIPLLSNQTALKAMEQKAQELGFQPKIVSAEIYDDAKKTIKLLAGLAQPNSALIAGGEISVTVTTNTGTGGRNLYLALNALQSIKANQLFISFASDGLDNGPAAGAIVDAETINKAQELKLDIDDYLKRFDSYPVFEKLNAIVFTGPTQANISDLMLLLEK